MWPIHRHDLGLPSVLEERLHRLAQHDLGLGLPQAGGGRDSGPVQQRVMDASRTDRQVLRRRRDTRTGDHERHVHRGLVDQVAVQRLAVVAQPLAVVADEDDRGRRLHELLEGRDEAAQLLVHRGDFSQVRGGGKLTGIRFRRCVGVMWIEVVHPEEERLRGRLGQKCQGGLGRLPRAPFLLPPAHPIVVTLEAASETEAARKGERRDERGGAVARVLQLLRHEGVRRGQRAPVLVHLVTGRVQPGHHRDVRGQRLGHRGVRLAETDPACGHRIERRRPDAPCLGANRVGPRRVERNEENGGTRLCRGCRAGAALLRSTARPHRQARGQHAYGRDRSPDLKTVSRLPEHHWTVAWTGWWDMAMPFALTREAVQVVGKMN